MTETDQTQPAISCLGSLSDERREEFWALLAFRYTPWLGCITAKRLLMEYGSAREAMRDIKGWAAKASISARVIEGIVSNRWRTAARKEWELAGKISCELVFWADDAFPSLLREIPDPPLFLYCKGDTSLLSNPSIGVVGSRNCSADGIATTEGLSRTLSASGVTTVSGLARGIDAVAHTHALEGWGSTVAVLGTGITHVYPRENEALFYDIARKGLVISEFPPNAPPEGKNFPMRNRIISGLSLGVLVVEATPKSGSLITAKHALEQGREVFAVPGRIQARSSSGCHALLRQGATAVFSCDDILVEIAPLLGISADTFHKEHVAFADANSSQEEPQASSGDSVSTDAVSDTEAPSREAVNGDLEITTDEASKTVCDTSSDTLSGVVQETTLSTSSASTGTTVVGEAPIPPSDVQGGSIGELTQMGGENLPTFDSAPFSKPMQDEGAQPVSNTEALSLEEQLRSIPEVIEIACAPPVVFDDEPDENVISKKSKRKTPKQHGTIPKPFDHDAFEAKAVDTSASLEEQLISLLTDEDGVHIDVLSRKLALSSASISTALLMLEVSGTVQQQAGMMYRLV